MKKLKPSFYNLVLEGRENQRIMYNSLSKAYIQIDEGLLEKDNLNMEKLVITGKENIDLLIQMGFLVEDEENELDQIEYVYNKYYFSATSLNIILTPTLRCNFKCPYCFEAGYDSKWNEQELYFATLKKYAKKYFPMYNSVEISLFGGEPLLCKDAIFDFLEYIKKREYAKKITTSITTNGSLLDENVIDNLNKYNCRAVQITIDGTEKIHDANRIFKNGQGSFKLLINKIKLLVTRLDPITKIILRINLNNVSPKDVESTLELFDKKECNRIELLFRPIYQTHDYHETNLSKLKHLREYYEMGKKLGFSIVTNNYFYKTCEACGDDNFFYLMPDLSMWKCINDLSFEKAKIGKIIENGEVKINSSNLINWRKAANCFEDKNCKECKLLPDCYGGCVLHKAKSKSRLCKEFSMASLPYFYENS